MPAGRAARDADAIRVDVVLLGIGPQPAHRGLGVVDRGRERILGSEPVADRHRDVALLREADALGIVALARCRRGSRRRGCRGRRGRPAADLGPGQVELQMLIVRVRVLDAGLEGDVRGDGWPFLRRGRQRGEEQAQTNGGGSEESFHGRHPEGKFG